MREIIFLYYNGERCHAAIVDKLSVEPTAKNYIGEIDGYEIYRTYRQPHFDQFGFEAIKEDKR